MSLEFHDMPLRRCASKAVARRQLILGSDQRRCSQFALVANGRTPANCVVRSRDRECPLNVDFETSLKRLKCVESRCGAVTLG